MLEKSALSEVASNELMIRFQAGDESAFNEIVFCYQDRLVNFVRGKTGFDLHRCQDVVQEVFLKVHTNKDSYREMNLFEAWLFRITHNCAMDALRKEGSRRKLYDAPFDETLDSDSQSNRSREQVKADVLVGTREFSQIVYALLDDIPEEQRLAFCLSQFGDLSLSMIAEATDCRLPTVKSRLRLAREKLRAMLQRHHPEYIPGSDWALEDDDVFENPFTSIPTSESVRTQHVATTIDGQEVSNASAI